MYCAMQGWCGWKPVSFWDKKVSSGVGDDNSCIYHRTSGALQHVHAPEAEGSVGTMNYLAI